MIVLSNKCKKCNRICYTKRFQQNFKNWTSGKNVIDRFIKNTQLSAHDNVKKALEWIPNDRINNIKCITKNRYIANWIDGNIIFWNNKNENWERNGQNMYVNLRCLESKNITLKYINEV
jgi:hypothetical protein